MSATHAPEFRRFSIRAVYTSAGAAALSALTFLCICVGCAAGGGGGGGSAPSSPPVPPTTALSTVPTPSPTPTPAVVPHSPPSPGSPPAPPAPTAPAIWITAYYASWTTGTLPPSNVDFTAMTHVVHFSVVPRADGTLDAAANGVIDAAAAAALIAPAHAAGTKVLLALGGAGSGPAFEAAMADAVRPTLVANVVGFVAANGYDGVDLDMEPLLPVDAPAFALLVHDLRAALKARDPSSLLTVVCGPTAEIPAIVAPVQAEVDQLNLETYDMSNLWPGWTETWHNAPLSNGGLTFATTGGPLPCADLSVQWFAAAGVPRSKLGIGVEFHAYVWHGATGPNQSNARVTIDASYTYSQVMDLLYQPAYYGWDAGAQSCYLGIPGADPRFVSYEDATACGRKVQYVKGQGLGGLIIWELAGGYRTSQPAGQRDLLLQSIKTAAR